VRRKNRYNVYSSPYIKAKKKKRDRASDTNLALNKQYKIRVKGKTRTNIFLICKSITNLLSAIPVFGKDLVELIWTLESIFYLLIFSFILCFTRKFSTTLSCLFIKIEEATLFIKRRSSTIPSRPDKIWPRIGKINWSKVRNEVPLTQEEIEYYKSLSCDWLARLLGIIDGDGYISVVKSNSRGNINISLKVGLIYKDLEMLESIKETLKIGRIAGPYKNIKGQDTIYLIFNRTELQQVLFPLLIFNNLFYLNPERLGQYKKALFYMESGEVKFKDDLEINNDPKSIEQLRRSYPSLSSSHEFIFKLPNLPETAKDFIALPFFSSWLVGFTIAEGSFFVKSNLDACFEVRQRLQGSWGAPFFLSLNLLFKSTRKIGIEEGKYAKFSVSSKAHIQEVINFFSFSSNPPLMGSKLQQYLNWLELLKVSKRYNYLKFPKP
jgi:hypothetical protein